MAPETAIELAIIADHAARTAVDNRQLRHVAEPVGGAARRLVGPLGLSHIFFVTFFSQKRWNLSMIGSFLWARLNLWLIIINLLDCISIEVFTPTRGISRTTRRSPRPAGVRQFTARFASVEGSRVRCDRAVITAPGRWVRISHDLGQRLFNQVQRHLAAKGLKVATGTIVDATIITAPFSTKNADKARDPEMRQTKKGNQW